MIPLEFPPGVYAAPTKTSRSVNWREVNRMRWDGNRLVPIGGWALRSYSGITANIRAIHQWTANNGIEYTAFLCDDKLYVDFAGTIYDISPEDPIEGPSSNVKAGGYGMGPYGKGTYGSPRPDRPRDTAIAPAFTLNNWGETLLAMVSTDGRLLQWTPTLVVEPCEVVENAPLGYTFEVTPERHVVMFRLNGVFNEFGWCDQEDITNWNFADVASKAGFYAVEPSAPIIGAKKSPDGLVFFTTTSAYVITHIGLPYVYNYREIGSSAAPISAAAVAFAGDNVFWYSTNGFWRYDGVSVYPLPCTVLNWIDDNIDPVYSRFRLSMFDMASRSELWVLFPSTGEQANDKYVIYNYRDDWWAMGELDRSCGFGASLNSPPIMASGTEVYTHEKGVASGARAETFALGMGDGFVSTVRQMIPDIKGPSDNIRFRFALSMARSGPVENPDERISAPKLIRSDGYVDVFETGRDIRIIIEDTVGGVEWTMGQTLIDVTRRGQR